MNLYTFRFPLDYQKTVDRTDQAIQALYNVMVSFSEYFDNEYMAFKNESNIHQDFCSAEFKTWADSELLDLHLQIALSNGGVHFVNEWYTADEMQELIDSAHAQFVEYQVDMNWPLEENGDISYLMDIEDFTSYSIDFSVTDPNVAMVLKLKGFEEQKDEF